MKLVTRIRDEYHLKGNVIAMLVNRLIDYTGWQMFDVIWQPYLISIGASMLNIGLLSTIYSALFATFQFFTGSFSDACAHSRLGQIEINQIADEPIDTAGELVMTRKNYEVKMTYINNVFEIDPVKVTYNLISKIESFRTIYNKSEIM